MMLSRREAASQLRRAGVSGLDLMLRNQEVRMLLFPPNVVTNGYHIPVATPDSPCHHWAGNLVSNCRYPSVSIPWLIFTPPKPKSKTTCLQLQESSFLPGW